MTSADTDPGPPTPDWLFAAHVIVGAPLAEDASPNFDTDSTSRRPTTLFVPPATPGFNSRTVAKPVVHFWHTANSPTPDGWVGSQPDININQVLQGVDIDIGPGNVGAIGVMHLGAQGSSIEDVTVWAEDAAAGISGGAGGGGSHANVRVVGGRFGLDLRAAQPAPTVTAATLSNQTCSSILYIGRGPLTLVGARIEWHSHSSDAVGLVAAGLPNKAFAGDCSLPVTAHPRSDGSTTQPFDGSVSIIDSSFDIAPPSQPAAATRAVVPMIASEKSVFMKGVYARGFRTLVELSGQAVLQPLLSMPRTAGSTANELQWNLVAEFAASTEPEPYYKSVSLNVCPAVAAPVLTVRLLLPPPQLQSNFQLHDAHLHWWHTTIKWSSVAPAAAATSEPPASTPVATCVGRTDIPDLSLHCSC